MPFRKPRGSSPKPSPGTAINWSHPLALGLVGAWLLNEGAGRKVGEITSRVSQSATLGTNLVWTQGKFGPAVKFDAASALDIGLSKPPALNMSGEMSVAVWCRPGQTGSQTYLAADFNGAGGLSQWAIRQNASGAYQFFANGGGSGAVGAVVVPANTWALVLATRSGTTGNWNRKIYVNGQLDGDDGGSVLDPDAYQGCALGQAGNYAGSLQFLGNIDCAFIWNRALPAHQVLAFYERTFAAFVTPRRRIINAAAAGAAVLRRRTLGQRIGTRA